MKRAPSSLEGAFLMISFPEQEKERLSSLFIIGSIISVVGKSTMEIMEPF